MAKTRGKSSGQKRHGVLSMNIDRALSAWKLVNGLNDPISGEGIQTELIAFGQDAVHALADFILRTPGNLRPRSLAAEALTVIEGDEAFRVLEKCLDAFMHMDDPVTALEEEAVKNKIAAELRHFGGKAAEPLLRALAEQRLIAAGESLAELREKRAIPLLVGMLEDSFKRLRAAEAIFKFGTDAVEELLKTVKIKKTVDKVEILPSIERRAEAARLIGVIGDRNAAPKLISLFDDEQESVRFEAASSVLILMKEKAPARAREIVKSTAKNLILKKRLRLEEIVCSMNTNTVKHDENIKKA